jgi:hypothetical protein
MGDLEKQRAPELCYNSHMSATELTIIIIASATLLFTVFQFFWSRRPFVKLTCEIFQNTGESGQPRKFLIIRAFVLGQQGVNIENIGISARGEKGVSICSPPCRGTPEFIHRIIQEEFGRERPDEPSTPFRSFVPGEQCYALFDLQSITEQLGAFYKESFTHLCWSDGSRQHYRVLSKFDRRCLRESGS